MLSQRTWVKLRPFLGPVTVLYYGVSWWRNFFYNIGFFIARNVPVPVVSIGNLSVGGTGKTPATIFCAGYLFNLGYRVGVVSRGYGRATSGSVVVSNGETVITPPREAGEEPCLIAARLPGVPVVVAEDRYRGTELIISRFSPDVIVLDDAFQHRGLDRECDLVLLDARAPVADYRIFPVGTLRERLGALKRADLVIWSWTNVRPPPRKIERRIAGLDVPGIQSRMEVSPQLVELQTGRLVPVENLQNRRRVAFCGIAQPQSFYSALVNLELEPESVRYYPDHHFYTGEDLAHLTTLAEGEQFIFLTTEKDGVKLDRSFLDAHPVYALRIDFALEGENLEVFRRVIHECLPLPRSARPVGEA